MNVTDGFTVNLHHLRHCLLGFPFGKRPMASAFGLLVVAASEWKLSQADQRLVAFRAHFFDFYKFHGVLVL